MFSPTSETKAFSSASGPSSMADSPPKELGGRMTVFCMGSFSLRFYPVTQRIRTLCGKILPPKEVSTVKPATSTAL